jgi:hypothetical protein
MDFNTDEKTGITGWTWFSNNNNSNGFYKKKCIVINELGKMSDEVYKYFISLLSS